MTRTCDSAETQGHRPRVTVLVCVLLCEPEGHLRHPGSHSVCSGTAPNTDRGTSGPPEVPLGLNPPGEPNPHLLVPLGTRPGKGHQPQTWPAPETGAGPRMTTKVLQGPTRPSWDEPGHRGPRQNRVPPGTGRGTKGPGRRGGRWNGGANTTTSQRRTFPTLEHDVQVSML